MSSNESFIQEVSEEVRRDRLFGLFRKYWWIGFCLILLLVGGAGINEWRKIQERTVAESNGDALREILQNFSQDESLEAYFSYLDKDLPGKSLAILNPEFLLSGNFSLEKQAYLLDVAYDEDLPMALKDLALLYSFYLSDADYDEKMNVLNILSGPDRPYRFLAIEAKIDLLLGEKYFVEALNEINLIEADMTVAAGITSRIENLKRIIQDKIDSN